MGLNRPESSSMHHNNAHPAKRRKYLLSTPGPSDEVINDLLMDFKDTQLRQVIDVSMKGGDVRRSIRYIHARLPEKSPNEDQLDVLATSSVLDADKVIQSIEISPMPERRFFPMPAPQPNRQPPTQSSPVEHKDILSHNATQSLVYLPKLANNSNLLTPRSSTELFRKEIPMTPEPYLTPEPDLDAHPPYPPNSNIRPPTQAITCNCRSGCSSTRCKCYKSGRGCSPTPSSGCKCESCVNMLNDLSTFFGSQKSSPSSSLGPGIVATPDLLKWIRRELRNGRFDLVHPDTMEDLRSMLMGVEYGDMHSAPTFTVFSSAKLGEIGRAWMRANITEDERDDLQKELFKEAFAVMEGEAREPEKAYWCFCKYEWRQSILWQYCTKCDECRDIREWHCDKCGKRNTEGVCECAKVLGEESLAQNPVSKDPLAH